MFYTVFDFQAPGVHQAKIVYVNWNPDAATTQKKTLHASTETFFKQ